MGQPIIDFQELGLTSRLLAQGEEADLVVIPIHFTTHQAVGARSGRAASSTPAALSRSPYSTQALVSTQVAPSLTTSGSLSPPSSA